MHSFSAAAICLVPSRGTARNGSTGGIGGTDQSLLILSLSLALEFLVGLSVKLCIRYALWGSSAAFRLRGSFTVLNLIFSLLVIPY